MAASAFSKKLPYYVLPENLGYEQHCFALFYLAGLATAVEGSLESWKSWVVTYVCAVTPSFAKQLDAKAYQATAVEAGILRQFLGLYTELEAALGAEDINAVHTISDTLCNIPVFPLLPKMDKTLSFGDANGEWSMKPIVCHYAIMLYLAGKRVTGANHAQVTVARPKALKAKAHLEDEVSLLEGSFRMSDFSHSKINDAWSELGSVRSVVFTEYLKYESAHADESQNLIWTTMHLLRFSGMSHAAIIFNFIQVCPWVDEIPTLRPALAAYARSVIAAAKCDAKIFPYLKLIYGDKSTFFARKDMEPLIACAVNVLAETNQTLAAYFTKPEFTPIVDAFTALREEKEAKGDAAVVLDNKNEAFADEEQGEDVD